ncbi:TPA: ead/Ea22-like family protein [Klebsiella pneumoniae]|uniref:ead/Ea22-like family protein n=1 Tax=Klebsiella quasipneumoniae TaxID=1463165 RepID=UPI00226FE21C|nr:ead/Ea22-like family protein [Klebsiella quasipneumoniae]MCX9886166.1 ead/Ea22-like family protein [Klebsiella quasipneumoniae]HBQ6587492.1 ead/Ea22-like family protein [Klebsiella quasipneumoniae subsp. similipneumoniae]HDG7871825.1 ead/Ea22-like family protein [Klebsiella quasipneumoniae]HEL6375913.1 ead/Ea22-like family protein [Klebsiella pneumoniae]
MTDITELAQSLKAEAEKATPGSWRAFQYHDGRCGIGGGHNAEIMVCEHISKERPHDAMFIALANPANILALVEALEKAQQRITQLESRTVKLPDDEDGQAYGFGKWSNGKLPATAGTMTISYCEDAWRAAFEVFSSAAGIKVEAE